MSDQPQESLPTPEQVELSYEGGFDVDNDRYVIEAKIGQVSCVVALPVGTEASHLATLLAAMPAVVEALVDATDDALEAEAEALDRQAAEGKHRGEPAEEETDV